MKWILLLFILLAPHLLSAQGTKGDYERSANFKKNYPFKVVKKDLDPNWLSDDRVWFVDNLGDGNWQYLLADRATGAQRIILDEKVFRKALQEAVPGKSKNLEKDIQVIDITETEIVFRYQEKNWSYAPGGAVKAWEVKVEKDPPKKAQAKNAKGTPTGHRSPDKKWEVEIKDHNVWLEDLENKESHQLTSDGSETNGYHRKVFWAPDSSRFVLPRVAEAQKHTVSMVISSPKDQVQPTLKQHNYLKPGDRIRTETPCLFDVEGRKRIPIDPEAVAHPWAIRDYQWWPDSSGFTFLYNRRGHQVLQVLAVDGKTGDIRPLIDERSDTFIDYAFKSYLHIDRESREMIWMSERSGWNHLYRIDGHTGKAEPITRGEWLVRKVLHRDDEARVIWFMACGVYPDQDPYYQHLGRVNIDGSGLTWLTEGKGTHEIKFSPENKTLFATWSRVDQAPVHEFRDAVTGKLLCELDRADDRALRKSGWRYAEPFKAKGRDGKTEIHGVIVRPTTMDAAKKYPVLEHIYAGPHGQHVPKDYRESWNMQRMAELGFIVVMIDGMGTNWRSKKFHDVAWRNLKDSGLPDRIAWMEAAAEKYPEMDVTRVGIYGGSAGGQNAMAAVLHHSDFYKAAAADCGCHDNRMDKIWWNEAWMGWPVGDWYHENSNVTHAHKLGGKLLLTVGELDTNVDPASTMQVVNALIKADKDFELVVFPNGGHGSGESPYGWRRRADFFVRHLMGVEPRR